MSEDVERFDDYTPRPLGGRAFARNVDARESKSWSTSPRGPCTGGTRA